MAVGSGAGSTFVSGVNTILIGKSAQPSSTTIDNHLNIGNSIYADLINKVVGINKTNPAYTFEVAGTGAVTSGAPSDIRLKKNVVTMSAAMQKLASLRGVYFAWTEHALAIKKVVSNKIKEIGLIAQELEKIFPDVVYTGMDGYKSVAYEKMVSPVIEAIRYLYNQLIEDRQRIERMKIELNKMIMENEHMKRQVSSDVERSKS